MYVPSESFTLCHSVIGNHFGTSSDALKQPHATASPDVGMHSAFSPVNCSYRWTITSQ